jgi:NDP-sugar pyrophosphorylase family protein
MRAMILAAGLGTRLRPLTDTVPKPLLDVAGEPMIAFSLRLLRAAQISEVVINLHHLGEQIRSTLGDGRAYGVHITYSDENPILDTGGAIAAARAFLADDTFVVVNADTVIDLSLQRVIDAHRRAQATATMVLRPDPEAERYGLVEIDAGNRVRRILGRPAAVRVHARRRVQRHARHLSPVVGRRGTRARLRSRRLLARSRHACGPRTGAPRAGAKTPLTWRVMGL